MITQVLPLTDTAAESFLTFPNPEDICFLDLESSGYARKNARLCYAGCTVLESGVWVAHMWISEGKEEEAALLKELLSFLKSYSTLVTFGGASFDLPFLKKKCAALSLPYSAGEKRCVDLYWLFHPFLRLFGLAHMDQKTLEHFLSLTRKPEDNDLTMLVRLLPLLRFVELREASFRVSSFQAAQSGERFEAVLSLSLSDPLPVSVSHLYDSFYFKASGTDVQLLIYGYTGTLKHFFPDYKNYYYLPAEDQAMHKSVAAYVSKENRVPAKASTCYIKKSGQFLPAFGGTEAPLFSTESGSSASWFLFPEEWTGNPEKASGYARALLQNL